MAIKTLSELKAANKALGRQYFERGTMRFFGSRIVWFSAARGLFIDETNNPPYAGKQYKVKRFSPAGEIDTVEDAASANGGWPTLADAKAFALSL